jgi:hypothetical protein
MSRSLPNPLCRLVGGGAKLMTSFLPTRPFSASTLLGQLKTFNATTQQALAKILGSLCFQHTTGCSEVVCRLLGLVEVGVRVPARLQIALSSRRLESAPDAAVSFYGDAGARSQSKDFVSDVEVRRNAFEAVCAIAANPANRLVGQR